MSKRRGPASARNLQRSGIPAVAVVRSIGRPAGGGPSPKVDVEMDVRVGDDEPYPVGGRFSVSRGARLAVGDELRVRIDPRDREELVIDWPSSWSHLIRQRGATPAG